MFVNETCLCRFYWLNTLIYIIDIHTDFINMKALKHIEANSLAQCHGRTPHIHKVHVS